MPNMELINKVTVGSGGAANISFTSIPQTYTDLVVKWSLRNSDASFRMNINVTYNAISSGYSSTYIAGQGTGAASAALNATGTTQIYSGEIPAATGTTSTFSNGEIYIPNYTSSNHKSASIDNVQESNQSTNVFATLVAGSVSNTAAISTVVLTPGAGNFVQYSTAYLYGVTSVTSSAKATGGTITSDGAYFYHTFTSSGTFTPTQSLTADYLVVAGGGGGGDDIGGGGGAGGLRSTVTATGGGGSLETALSLALNNSYTVTVGAGGANGVNGSNSVFSTITSTGGGFGASGANGNAGGSGGGGRSPGGLGGAGTANQGYAGGAGGSSSAGGGGGANAVGANAGSNTGGAGGAGVATSITGSSVTYAGGGGGRGNPSSAGAGGVGGGGAGNGTAGTVNTGGGGGGGVLSGNGGAGGSGLVIIRYAV